MGVFLNYLEAMKSTDWQHENTDRYHPDIKAVQWRQMGDGSHAVRISYHDEKKMPDVHTNKNYTTLRGVVTDRYYKK